jgi:hypothetical protein
MDFTSLIKAFPIWIPAAILAVLFASIAIAACRKKGAAIALSIISLIFTLGALVLAMLSAFDILFAAVTGEAKTARIIIGAVAISAALVAALLGGLLKKQRSTAGKLSMAALGAALVSGTVPLIGYAVLMSPDASNSALLAFMVAAWLIGLAISAIILAAALSHSCKFDGCASTDEGDKEPDEPDDTPPENPSTCSCNAPNAKKLLPQIHIPADSKVGDPLTFGAKK